MKRGNDLAEQEVFVHELLTASVSNQNHTHASMRCPGFPQVLIGQVLHPCWVCEHLRKRQRKAQ